jgi:hypothetical protein
MKTKLKFSDIYESKFWLWYKIGTKGWYSEKNMKLAVLEYNLIMRDLWFFQEWNKKF